MGEDAGHPLPPPSVGTPGRTRGCLRGHTRVRSPLRLYMVRYSTTLGFRGFFPFLFFILSLSFPRLNSGAVKNAIGLIFLQYSEVLHMHGFLKECLF